MRLKDVMTEDVLVVSEQTPFKEIAVLLETNRVSAVPVLDHQTPVGVVSEADLLPRADRDRPEGRSWLQVGRRRAEERKAHGVCARDLMSSPPIVIAPEASVSEAARQMLEHHVKRLLVVGDSGRLVGIVSRSDLLKVVARSDEEIKNEIETDILQRTLLLSPGQVEVRVDEGVVRLQGQVDQRSEVSLLARLVAGVDGVVDVDRRVDYRWDNSRQDFDPWGAGLILPPW